MICKKTRRNAPMSRGTEETTNPCPLYLRGVSFVRPCCDAPVYEHGNDGRSKHSNCGDEMWRTVGLFSFLSPQTARSSVPGRRPACSWRQHTAPVHRHVRSLCLLGSVLCVF